MISLGIKREIKYLPNRKKKNEIKVIDEVTIKC